MTSGIVRRTSIRRITRAQHARRVDHAPAPRLRRRAVAAVLMSSVWSAAYAQEAAHGTLPTAVSSTGTSTSTAAAANSESKPLTLPDVTVSAERRSTSLQKTPIAVNAISASELRNKGIVKLNDLAGVAAGVTVPNSWTGTQAIFIRGIGTSRPIGNASVGLYLDDVYIARPFGAGFYGSLPDIERVEILHGPQGTLYGQNTSAGALKFVSRTPTDEPVAWVTTSVGNRSAFNTSGYVSGAIKPGVLDASLAYSHEQSQGDVINKTLGRNVGNIHNDQLRAIFHLTPTSDFDATLSIDTMRDRSDTATASPIGYPGGGQRLSFSALDPTNIYGGGGVTLKMNKRIDDHLSVHSISAARGFNTTVPTDIDGLAANTFGFTQDLMQRQVSQELQLQGDYDRFSFLAGIAYFHERFDVDRLSWGAEKYSILQSQNTTDTAGIYGQGTYKITPRLNLTAGLRFNYERKTMDSAAWNSDSGRDYLSQIYSVRGLNNNYRAVTPKLTLDYQLSPDTLAYATWAKGETSGGFNPIAGTLAIATVPIEQERVTSYELGLKRNDWGGRIHSSVALFYNDYKDYQASVSNPVINGQVIAGGVVVNAGKAHTYGAEFETAFLPTSRLEGRLSLTYLRTRFDSFTNPTGASSTNFVGQDLPNAPHFSASASATYRQPITLTGGNLRINGDVRYETSSFSEVSATRNLTKYPSQVYLDASAYYTTANGLWTMGVSVRNLLNHTYALPLADYIPAYSLNGTGYSLSRTILFSVRRDFI